jgi:hypothetical protein
VFFTSCGPDAGRELAIRSMSLQANVAGESASGSHTYVEQINLPLGGTMVGSVTYAGNVAMSRHDRRCASVGCIVVWGSQEHRWPSVWS